MSRSNHNNVISFVAHGAANVEIHRHHCYQIVASVRGTFRCSLSNVDHPASRGFVINQNVPHSCQAPDASVLVYFVDAESYCGWQLRELLAENDAVDFASLLSESELTRMNESGYEQMTASDLRVVSDKLFELILSIHSLPNEPEIDSRVVAAMKFIDEALPESINLERVSDVMHLSVDRSRHLFAQQTGTPFSQYVLWKRIRRVIASVLNDQRDLTTASLAEGFADQAHFCRTFTRMFGMSPKSHLKNSRFVQFLNPRTW